MYIKENQNEREKMLAQIAHEIRNPLGGIELLVNLVKEDLSLDDKHKEYLNKILLEVNGISYEGFTSISVFKRIETLSGTFSFTS